MKMRNLLLFIGIIFLVSNENLAQTNSATLIYDSNPYLIVTGDPSPDRIGINYKGQCFLLDKNGNKELLPFDSVSYLTNGYWQSCTGALCGVYKEGKGLIIPEVYDNLTCHLSPNENPLFVVSKYGLNAIVDDKNQQLFEYRQKPYALKFINDTIINFGRYKPEVFSISGRPVDEIEQEKYKEPYIVRETSSNYVLIRYDNGVQYRDTFSGHSSFNFGLAIVKKGEKWGCIRKNGTWLFKPEFDNFQPFEKVRMAVVRKEGLEGIVNTMGELVVPINYKSLFILNSDYFISKSDGINSLIEFKTMKKVITGPFSSYFSPGGNEYLGAKSGDSVIIYKKNGEMIPFNSLQSIVANNKNENLLVGLHSKGYSGTKRVVYGLLNSNMEWLIQPVLLRRADFFDHFLIAYALTDPCCTVNGISFSRSNTTNKWLVFSSNGKPILPFEVDMAKPINNGPYLYYKSENKFGLVDSEGQRILEGMSSIKLIGKNWLEFSENGNVGLYFIP
jgi:hypothetical protein